MSTRPRRPVFLYRPTVLDRGELDAAAKHFDVAESRLDVREGDLVIARHFAWPWPKELFGDLRRLGARALNGLRGHVYAADLLGWTADLGDLAPFATDRFEALPEVGPFIIKGEKADKGRWDRMFAATKADAGRVRSELMADSGMRGDTIVARQKIDLEPLGVGVIPGACPLSVEYRVFVARGEVISRGLYWPPEDCERLLLARAPKPEAIPADFLFGAIRRLPSCLEFYTLDVGLATDGRWWVIEVSDGLRAGMCENDPETVYAGLARVLARDV
jgi:ATP-grasp domain, R2K clade family 3